MTEKRVKNRVYYLTKDGKITARKPIPLEDFELIFARDLDEEKALVKKI